MKKGFLLFMLCLLGTVVPAQERIFVATDRPAYIAGDLVYCSLFCVDNEGRQSDFSAVAYLELISADGTAVEAKLGLFQGRGAGSFRIPATTPTGNYRLMAYTARSQAAPEGARTLAVYNTSSTERVNGGVALTPGFSPVLKPEAPAQGGLSLSVSGKGREKTLLLGALDQAADLSLSVYHDDALSSGDGVDLSAFLKGKPALPGSRSGEYEGEVVLAAVEGLPAGADPVTAYLSTAGAPSNVYIGRSDENGLVRFFTGNIYGQRELVCETDRSDTRLTLLSPFTHPGPGTLPVLQLGSAQKDALTARRTSLQAHGGLSLDTLVRFLPRRQDQLLSGQKVQHYHLDDYTRFASIQEVCVEIVHPLQFVRRDGEWKLRLITTDPTNSRRFVQDNVLVMMDGVVLTNVGILNEFDALLLEDVDIYPQPVVMGTVPFNGVVNFVTKKNYVTALHFPENVRVVDFQGVAYPVAYPGQAPAGTDLRQLLYWHPALETKAGTPERLRLTMPSYQGRFRVVAEGWKADGTPVRAEYLFETD